MLLVTGGAGFIGGALVEHAIAQGRRVRILDSLRPDVHGDSPVIPDGVELIRADVTDPAAVRAALVDIDMVAHLAAKVGLGVDFSDAPDYAESNVLGTATLLAEVSAAGIDRVVVASSMVVYGEGVYAGPEGLVRPAPRRVDDLRAGRFDPTDELGRPLQPQLIEEAAPLDPRNIYAVTKLAQEQLASSWARATGGRAVALRYHNVYGPGMPHNTPYAGVASLFRSAIERGESPRVFEDGRQRRDFVQVRDVAAASLAAVDWTADAAPGTFRAFNVGSGTVHTIGEFAEQLSRSADGPTPIVTGEFRLGDVRHITASSERIRRETGWLPVVSFEEGVREFGVAPLRPAAR